MAELVVVGFDNVTEADRALMELARLQKDYLIDLEDAVVAIRQPDGKVNLKQSINLVGIGAASGGLSGALWMARFADQVTPRSVEVINRICSSPYSWQTA